jgi:hypothetical protein
LLRTSLRHLCSMAICGQQTARLVRTVRLFTIRRVTGETESVIWRCSRYIRISHRKFMMATSPYPLPGDFLDRQPVYQLYTLFNRAILFGGQHLVTAQKALERVLAA